MSGHTDFQEVRTRVFSLHAQGMYREALELAIEAAREFPEREAETVFWKACLHSRVGQTIPAIRTLREALKNNIWWSDEVLLRDSDLQPLLHEEEFKLILAECGRLKREAQAQAKPELLVLTPSDYSHGKKHPLIIALHQRYGRRPAHFATHWKNALSSGFVLAVPWSSQVYAVDGRCWDNIEQSEQDIVTAYSRLLDSYSVDSERVVVAGFSQGAALAIYLALNKTFPCRGFIAVASSDWVTPERRRAAERIGLSETFANFIRGSDGRDVKGWLLAGDRDSFLPKIRSLHDEMVRVGVECKLVVETGLGHEFPNGFETRLSAALDYVLN